jgi:hypothetical protein
VLGYWGLALWRVSVGKGRDPSGSKGSYGAAREETIGLGLSVHWGCRVRMPVLALGGCGCSLEAMPLVVGGGRGSTYSWGLEKNDTIYISFKHLKKKKTL